MDEPLCPCGRPLHYSDPEDRRKVDEFVARLGPDVLVSTSRGQYTVSRHYIALHGLRPGDLEALAAVGVVRRLD